MSGGAGEGVSNKDDVIPFSDEKEKNEHLNSLFHNSAKQFCKQNLSVVDCHDCYNLLLFSFYLFLFGIILQVFHYGIIGGGGCHW